MGLHVFSILETQNLLRWKTRIEAEVQSHGGGWEAKGQKYTEYILFYPSDPVSLFFSTLLSV